MSPARRAPLVIGSKIVPNNCADVELHCQETLDRLQLECIDLYMVHWPAVAALPLHCRCCAVAALSLLRCSCGTLTLCVPHAITASSQSRSPARPRSPRTGGGEQRGGCVACPLL